MSFIKIYNNLDSILRNLLVAGNICQGLAVKLGKAFIYDRRDIDVNEISYISQQCEIALQNISKLGLTEAKNNEMNNIIAKYNGNEQ